MSLVTASLHACSLLCLHRVFPESRAATFPLAQSLRPPLLPKPSYLPLLPLSLRQGFDNVNNILSSNGAYAPGLLIQIVVMKVGGRIHNRPVQGCASLHSSRSWYTLPAWRLCVTAVHCHHSSVLLHGLPQVIATAICRGSGLQVSCQGWRTCLGIHQLLAAQAQHATTQFASGVAHCRFGPPPLLLTWRLLLLRMRACYGTILVSPPCVL